MNTVNRRDFLAQSAALAGTALLPFSNSARAEAPPEVNKIRLVHTPGICLSPQYLAEEFLRLEGFSEIEYVESPTTFPANFVASGQADFTQDGVTSLLPVLDAGKPLVALSGVHSGCYELFGNGRVKSVADLRGKTIAIPEFGSSEHTFMASILGYIGIDPRKEVKWVKGATGMDAMTLFMDGKADAILGFAPQPRDLRAKKIGHVILNTTQDRPWSQYFCCVVVARREFVAQNPIATRRALRAFLKSADVCSNEPERAARMLVDKGYESRYDVALEVLKELPYTRWRQANPEDTLRFYALRLHEVGMIKSSPQKLIAQGTNWRFLNELKKELKA